MLPIDIIKIIIDFLCITIKDKEHLITFIKTYKWLYNNLDIHNHVKKILRKLNSNCYLYILDSINNFKYIPTWLDLKTYYMITMKMIYDETINDHNCTFYFYECYCKHPLCTSKIINNCENNFRLYIFDKSEYVNFVKNKIINIPDVLQNIFLINKLNEVETVKLLVKKTEEIPNFINLSEFYIKIPYSLIKLKKIYTISNFMEKLYYYFTLKYNFKIKY